MQNHPRCLQLEGRSDDRHSEAGIIIAKAQQPALSSLSKHLNISDWFTFSLCQSWARVWTFGSPLPTMHASSVLTAVSSGHLATFARSILCSNNITKMLSSQHVGVKPRWHRFVLYCCHDKTCCQALSKSLCAPELHLKSCFRLMGWLLQLREDVTRYRYGDEQHLDESLGKIFMFNRVGALICSTAYKLSAVFQSPCKVISRVQADTSQCCCSGCCALDAFTACK